MKSFDAVAYLSPDVEAERLALRQRHQMEFTSVEGLAERAISELTALNFEANQEYLLGVGFWLRCLECCQGAVLLVERGLPSAPFPTLRTAFECLFFACALWRNPALVVTLLAGHDAERVKQAKQMIAAGAAARVPPAGLADLHAIAAESVPASAGLTAWEAARAADLIFEYETAYRGFSIAGAHASLRSLDDYIVEQADGSFDLGLQSSSQRTAWLLGLVSTCLTCGIERHHEARSHMVHAAGTACP